MTTRKSGAESGFPSWTVASPKRRKHVERVVELLERWAKAMRIPKGEADRWRAAGYLHDALRDAPDDVLREYSGDKKRAAELLHGPAAAVRAGIDGEQRQDVLDAVRYHTVGWATWTRTGRALYMADFLEPGRKFLVSERAYLANQVPSDFDGTFREVVRLRLNWTLGQNGELFPETVDLWHAVR
ncbi:MAG TPA: HD domain-containing protein [Gemmatimonadaceae bacterium]